MICECGGYMRRREISAIAGDSILHLNYRQCVMCDRLAWFQLYNAGHELLDRGTPAYRWFTEATGREIPVGKRQTDTEPANAPEVPTIKDSSQLIYTGAFVLASLIVVGLLIVVIVMICGRG